MTIFILSFLVKFGRELVSPPFFIQINSLHLQYDFSTILVFMPPLKLGT